MVKVSAVRKTTQHCQAVKNYVNKNDPKFCQCRKLFYGIGTGNVMESCICADCAAKERELFANE
jgi:hypothetical protein